MDELLSNGEAFASRSRSWRCTTIIGRNVGCRIGRRPNPASQIASLVNSEQTAIRFCLPTQLLGKLTEPSLDALCLQRGDGADGRWDPRSFASAVIVPWNRASQNVLGRGAV
ncbi:MAG: restriction endonuclease, SacI family [Phyllobacteriaceae bacterium]|nr:restriction endonuclease, SacI family [Phyllobacteriaceae bacterium]